MATLSVPATRFPAAPSRRWIIGCRTDLALVIGASAAGYLYLFLCTVLHVPISYLWWVWSVGLDGTHIFATASRTYFDPLARRKNRALFFGSLAFFFALGPLLVLAGYKLVLALIVGVWAYYHVMRQHHGVMVLYKVKNRDLAPVDNLLDRIFLAVMLVFPPFHRFFLHHPTELGLKGGLPAAAEPVIWVLAGITAATWGWRQVLRTRRGDPLNAPKFLLLGSVVPLHWLTFAYMSWQAAVPTVTIVHNLQYHALVWFHNRNRYGEAGWRSLGAYVALGIAFSALYRVPGFQLARLSDIAFGFFCGFGLTHYYLDSKIWRVRHDPGLREALRLG